MRRSKKRHPSSKRPTPKRQMKTSSTCKILSIDDDPDTSQAIGVRFQDYNADLLSAFHGMQGFRLATVERPDLIITDINMPQGPGDCIVECLKRNAETCNIPLIVLSGCRNSQLERRMRDLGVDEFIAKPCRLDDLLAIMKKYVQLVELAVH